MRRRIGNIVLVAAFVVGVLLFVYPSVSEWWNASRASRVVDSYTSTVNEHAEEERASMLEEARSYNESLLTLTDRYHPSSAVHERYLSTLDPAGDGVMCWIEIPKISVRLPVYHSVDDEVLNTGVGHLEGSSLPVGGPSTHAVLSGHRGLPSARLLTDIDQLVEGDHFMVHVLDETLTYEVDQIRIVEPDELDDLEIEDGLDLCTLVTCTPYGVNTHRLLVRGHRVAGDPASVALEADAERVDPQVVAPLIAAPVLVALFALMLWRTRQKPPAKAPTDENPSDRKDETHE